MQNRTVTNDAECSKNETAVHFWEHSKDLLKTIAQSGRQTGRQTNLFLHLTGNDPSPQSFNVLEHYREVIGNPAARLPKA